MLTPKISKRWLVGLGLALVIAASCWIAGGQGWNRRLQVSPLTLAIVVGMAFGNAAPSSAVEWLHPGLRVGTKIARSAACLTIAVTVVGLSTQLGRSVDVSEDRRNSFPAADQKALAELHEPLMIVVRFAPEDPRYADLRRNVLAKLERVLPRVTIQLATSGQSMLGSASEEAYGEVEYSYGGHSDKSRSTSHREILPLIYALAGRLIPQPIAGEDYPGYPLLANASPALAWFLGGLPLLIVIAWWSSRRPPQIPSQLVKNGGLP